MHRGIQIKGYIDQRAEEICECNGLPVYHISEFQVAASPDAVIFVAVKNVYYHKEIARTLFQYGFFRVIYKSQGAINNKMTASEQILDEAYESIYKTGDIPEFEIPIVDPGQGAEWREPAKLRESPEWITLNVPMEQLYTGVTAEPWKDVPILSLIPHIRMFQYFEGIRKEVPVDYIKLCEKGARNENIEITRSWQNYVLENRFHTYEQMRWRYEQEPDYFVDQAPPVTWNERGYFNLQTGKHRICFLAAMNKMSAPVKIQKETFEKIAADPKWLEIKQLLGKKPERQLPVPHVLSQGNIQYHCMFQQQRLRRVFDQLYDLDVMHGARRRTCKLYNLMDNGGYFSTIFSQMGFDIYGNSQNQKETEVYVRLGMVVSDPSKLCGRQFILLAENECRLQGVQLPEHMEIFKVYADEYYGK